MIWDRPRRGLSSAKSNEKVCHERVCRVVMGDLLDKRVKSSPCTSQSNPEELAGLVGFLKKLRLILGMLGMLRMCKRYSRVAVRIYRSYLHLLSNLVDGLCQRQIAVYVRCDRLERVEVGRSFRSSIYDPSRQW